MTGSGSARYSSSELESMREARNYYAWILGQFAPYLGQRVVEVGAGTGNFAEFLLARPSIRALVLVEPADNLLPLLARRLSDDPRVRVVRSLTEVGPSFGADSVASVNVLEHVDDDEALLRQMHRVLAPGGRALLLVPAGPWLYGTLDAAFGHRRRYTKRSLTVRLERAGFAVIGLRHMNVPGVIGWAVAGKVLRRSALSRRAVLLYDRWVVPWAARLERRVQFPLGQSLVAIARK